MQTTRQTPLSKSSINNMDISMPILPSRKSRKGQDKKKGTEMRFQFRDMGDRRQLSDVYITNMKSHKTYTAKCTVKDAIIFRQRENEMSDIVYDLLTISSALFTADRLTKPAYNLPSSIEVEIPVLCVDVFSMSHIRKCLRDLLYWMTGDNWEFKFVPVNQVRQSVRSRLLLHPSNEGISTEVALFSGGLDSLAGLCNRITKNTAKKYLLLGSGANQTVQGIQRRVEHDLKQRLNELHNPTSVKLVQTYIDTEAKDASRNPLMRTRGIVFMLQGCALALLESQNRLMVYENGLGAFNLSFRASEVGLDHARSVHPKTLMLVSNLVSELTGSEFRIENPFLFWTKAQMCQIFSNPDFDSIFNHTVSCDHTLRLHHKHCGKCSSCILRRQSLAAAKLEDETLYGIIQEPTQTQIIKHHLPAMLMQVQTFQRHLLSQNPWSSLCHEYPTALYSAGVETLKHMGMSMGEFAEQILNLYRTYVDEWNHPEIIDKFQHDLQSIDRYFDVAL